ncbi:related to peroxisomal short-chain alcohol dehydrogenase [Cephalotrichum gorgonifer]|uniref:Related to peroxisomal short-chain alcohol dehydrogenase n=1 Tax=Cephalotrichum gorgonifer TaxID=2041049 RepID=A0AAE8SYU8_9PEZI|nr:related to peroxisomal short-chain alcohol dehydrogenase [Cephalotrichum gorgonifer]
MAAESKTFVSFTKTYHHKPYPYISPTRPELSAAGKNIVITGGGTGIGKAIAIAFAQANAASVSIIGRRLNRLEEAARDISAAAASPSVRVVTAQGDLSKRESADKAVAEIAGQVGKIDVFVSNAGIFSAPGPVAGYEEEEFRRGWEVNFMGAFNAVQAFVAHAAPKAKLINVSSGIAHIAPMYPGVWAYAAVKATIAKMLDFLAAENPDLHVVQIQPGVHATEMNEGFQDTSDDTLELPGEFTVWLSSPEAEFLKNRFVWVNWDAEELIARSKEIENDQSLLKIHLGGVPM